MGDVQDFIQLVLDTLTDDLSTVPEGLEYPLSNESIVEVFRHHVKWLSLILKRVDFSKSL